MATTHHVPNVSRYYAARTNHPCHLGYACGGIRNKEYHQRHNGGIKTSFGEGKRKRISQLKLRALAYRPSSRKG